MRQRSSVPRLLTDRNFLLLMSIVLGATLGKTARWTEPFTLPALAVAMTVSTTQVASSAFRPLRKLVRPMILSVVLNYIVLGTVMLALAHWLMPDRELWIGFVLVAAVPPGIAVIPFTTILGGDAAFSLVGSVGAYLAALAIMPAIALLFVGESFVQPLKLITILLELVALPLALSRFILASRFKQNIDRWRGTIVNWAFFLVIFTVVGLNRDVLVRQPRILVLTAAVGFATNFGLGFLLERIMKRLRVDGPSVVSYVLMGTVKNTGLSAATALALFGERASVPAAVVSAMNVLYLVWLGIRWEKR